MTGPDKAVRVAAVLAVLGVAGVAAWVSYRHCVTVVSAYGEGGWVGRFYPATIDGLIVASSMVLLDAARSRSPRPVLAVWMLGTGIAATLTVNVLAGVAYGPMGALWSAWPAGAFIGAYEALMLLVRAGARRSAEATRKATREARAKTTSTAPSKTTSKTTSRGLGAATEAAREAIAQGHPVPSARALARDHRIGRAKATEARAMVLAEANGRPDTPAPETS